MLELKDCHNNKFPLKKIVLGMDCDRNLFVESKVHTNKDFVATRNPHRIVTELLRMARESQSSHQALSTLTRKLIWYC